MIIIISVALTIAFCVLGLYLFGKYIEKKWDMVQEVPPRQNKIERMSPTEVEKYNEVMNHIAQERRKVEKELNNGN